MVLVSPNFVNILFIMIMLSWSVVISLSSPINIVLKFKLLIIILK